MRKLTALLAIALAIALAALYFLWPGPQSVRACLVTGDVAQELSLGAIPGVDYVKLPQGGRGLPLAELIEAAGPLSADFSVLLLSREGVFVQLKGDDLEDCYVSKKNGGWNTVAPLPSALIEDLSKIIVADDTGDLAFGVNVISQEENLLHLTPGNALRQLLTCYPALDGEENSVSRYRQKLVLPLTAVSGEEIRSVLVMGREGEYEEYQGNGFLEVGDREINFLQAAGTTLLSNIAGVIVNPPPFSVMDTYTDALYYLNRGERVLVIFIDGLGFYQYEEARGREIIPNLAAFTEPHRVNTVYKPVTNAGFAAMITGLPPVDNGIWDRSVREPGVPTIFDALEKEDKTHVLVEGSGGILKLNTETIYSADLYKDGSTDDDVFGNALAQMERQPDFLMVHFHGFDDAGHTYGPLADETLNVLATMDAYIGLLLKEWTGRVIIVADHGMHQEGAGGSHGNFQYEDIFVPYFIN